MTPPTSPISALPQSDLRSATGGWLFWLAAFAVVIAVIAATPPPRLAQRQTSADAALISAGPSEAPAPPPMVLAPVAKDDARLQNAAIPLIRDGFSKPTPFFYAGSGDDLARAIDCVAAAMLYEAGDDARGQMAVGQVVINRARHAAFPKSLCAVVFQGSERVTGCQFTFTCDGALARRYSAAAWGRAQSHARQMLNGSTADEVGLATHYHTDWVRPYWSDTLSKIAIIDTHLFFRWPGFWGTQPAFRHRVAGQEARIAKMMMLSAAHAGAALPIDDAALQDEDAMSAAKEAQIITSRKQQASRDTIMVELDTKASPESYLIMALRLCGDRDYCKLFGWTNPTLKPSSEAMSELQRAAMSFSYLRDDKANFEKPLWNCTEFKREDARQCMKR